MRTIIFMLLLSPLFGFSQNQQVFIKLTDNSGLPIKGEVFLKGYEKAIQAFTISAAGKNNTQLDFTMQVSGASADLKRAMSNGQFLSTGEVYVITPNQAAGTLLYTIKMEQITVLSCTEVMGCNNTMSTTVSLQATRIGWTYYAVNKTGVLAPSRKYGWDTSTGSEWTTF
jgi:type VI protein secretion system component Hcp